MDRSARVNNRANPLPPRAGYGFIGRPPNLHQGIPIERSSATVQVLAERVSVRSQAAARYPRGIAASSRFV